MPRVLKASSLPTALTVLSSIGTESQPDSDSADTSGTDGDGDSGAAGVDAEPRSDAAGATLMMFAGAEARYVSRYVGGVARPRPLLASPNSMVAAPLCQDCDCYTPPALLQHRAATAATPGLVREQRRHARGRGGGRGWRREHREWLWRARASTSVPQRVITQLCCSWRRCLLLLRRLL